MYKKINDLSRIFEEANQFVMDNDRSLYNPYLQVVEQFCIDNAILVGGAAGTDLLIGKPLSKDSYQWDLYTDDTFALAKKLADELYKVKSAHIDSRFVALRTDIKHREFTIMVNLRQIVKIYNLDKYRGLKLFDLMGPASRTGYFTKKIVQLVPEEIQIIELYRSLYSPGKLDRWETCLNAESILYNLISETLTKKSAIKVGGGPAPLGKLTRVLIDKMIKGSDYVVVGDYAAQLYGAAPKMLRLQILISSPIDEFIEVLRRHIAAAYPNMGAVVYVKYSVCLPTDFQIEKYTIYINRDDGKDSLLDIYNSPAYEVIPYRIEDGVKYGNPYVVLRFRFIELWILKLIANIDENSAKFLGAKMVELISTIADIREYIARADPEDLFQLNNYVGIYRDEDVAKKKLLQRFPLYYPFRATAAPTAVDSPPVET